MAKFRTSARTVDMLGRQQIAGIPTAISELFKNAHDAYATRVEADFYRPEQLLVLRDDGLGMTPKDIEERWLVLGTDSKVAGDESLQSVARDIGLAPRVPTGEKGIGRLAIAAIGPQALLVSRGRRSDGLQPTVASFVNWSLFALPGLPLDQIDVPVLEFLDGSLPDEDDLDLLVDSVRDNLRQVRGSFDARLIKEIEQQLNSASFDVSRLQGRFESARLEPSTTGTQFYIQPTDPMLAIALDAKPEQRRIGDLQKTLMGFTNTMIPGRTEPVITTTFRDHLSSDLSDSIIGTEEFFTPNEFEEADHHIRGQFDDYGQFVGTVSVYGGEPEEHIIPWPDAKGHPTACGPFSIDFAYLQGASRESRMPHDQWSQLAAKLDRMGGLYIYRNGIRVLPYGNTDFDFLGVEVRRNLGATYYFFSYRRMFGAIELPIQSSSRLVEKAGREGFRDNAAYRAFRAILEHFLIQLAADYFRNEATRGTQYRQTKSDLDRQTRARAKQAQGARERRAHLQKILEERGAMIASGTQRRQVNSALDTLTIQLRAASKLADQDSRLKAIIRAERHATSTVLTVRETLRIPQQRGFAIPKALRRDLGAYTEEYAAFNAETIQPSLAAIEEYVAEATEGLNLARRLRFDAATTGAQHLARHKLSTSRRYSEMQLRNTNKLVTEAVKAAIVDLESYLNETASRIQHTNVDDMSDTEIVELRLSIESEVNEVASKKAQLLDTITSQLSEISVTTDIDGEVLSVADTIGAMEEELLNLQERAEIDLELTQLGMAIEIIDHEFQAVIRSIRNNLRRFHAWADVNEQLADVYQGLSAGFDHLDTYLALFTPLHRRQNKTEIEIRGSDLSKFLRDLFEDRLRRHGIALTATHLFQRHHFMGHPSTFYPVFVNLVDNAIYWLRDQTASREIILNARGDTMLISDNGPGIPSQDCEAIFEMGFTRKPAGRGLGLYISKDVLKRANYDLLLVDEAKKVGTTFAVQPIVDNVDE